MGRLFMKTKIVYISGNEFFDMTDIRAAFEEVRCALNLDKETVLFGVPVDADDAGLATEKIETATETATVIPEPECKIEEIPEPIVSPIQDEIIEEPVIEKKTRKTTRSRKTKTEDVKEEPVPEVSEAPEIPEASEEEPEEKIVPIMSILSAKEEEKSSEPVIDAEEEIITQGIDIIQEKKKKKIDDEIPEEITEAPESDEDEEADLEKLLSAMTPLQEDVLEEKQEEKTPSEPEYNEDISVDATLEQLATEFAETQDKITTTSKPASRSKIGKLRNILPFKQSKHKDQGLGDLFGWAGVAANDEDFSVPGFFTNAVAKK